MRAEALPLRRRRGVARRLVLLIATSVIVGAFAPGAFAAHFREATGCPTGNSAIVNPTLSVVQGGTATATFKIARYCSHIQVSLASYDAPSGDFALPQTYITGQTGYFDYSSGKLYTLTVPVSPCYYQVDLVRGAIIANLTSSTLYGSRNLKWQNGGSPCASKLSTSASAAFDIGSGTIGDSAILSGLSTVNMSTAGTVTFKLWGPDNTTCSGSPVFTTTAAVNHGSGTYPGAATFTPSAVGTYRWIAYYGGSPQNASAAGKCNDSGESVLVRPRTPTLKTTASANVTLGAAISDTATLSSGYSPTGTISFRLYGPNDSMCSGPSLLPGGVQTVTVNGNATYGPVSYTPLHAGTYRWVASYSSANANNASVSGGCNDAGESVTVSPSGPSLTTHVANASVPFHGSTSDTATLSSATATAGGKITFTLYGPNDATCAGLPIYTKEVTVSGNGPYGSGSFTPTASGLYRWKATYSGDLDNLTVPLGCNESNEDTLVGDRDQSPALCVLQSTVAGPPKQLKITVQDAQSGISSIDVTVHDNASVTWPAFTAGATTPITVTASKTVATQSSHVALKVTNGEGLITVCDPLVPASKSVRHGASTAIRRAVAAGFTLTLSTHRIEFDSGRDVVMVGRTPDGRAGQVVTVLAKSCSVDAPAAIAKVTTGKGGVFRYRLQPALSTVFSARVGNRTTAGAALVAAPRIGLVRESAGRYRIDLATTNGIDLNGKPVKLQRKAGGKWIAAGSAALTRTSPADAMVETYSALVAGNLYGAQLRAVVAPTACYGGAASSSVIG